MERMPRTRRVAAAALAAATLAAAAPGRAQQEPAQDAVKRDLFAVIALEGKPCGAVTSVQRLGENDYVATCRTGDRYRVRIVNGRVSIEEQ
jgi:hypothetical protein